MKTWRRLPYLVLVLGALTLASTLISRRLRAQLLGSREPFSATVIVKYFTPDGSLLQTDSYRYAFRSDGSSVREILTTNSMPTSGMKTVVNVANGTRVAVDPVGRSKTTYKLTGPELNALATPPACGVAIGGPVDLFGEATFHVSSDATLRNTRFQDDEWVAPRLGCFPLRRSYKRSEHGALVQTGVEEVASLSMGEPDPGLFVIPAGLTERSPSEAMSAAKAARGQTCRSCVRPGTPDKVYAARR